MATLLEHSAGRNWITAGEMLYVLGVCVQYFAISENNDVDGLRFEDPYKSKVQCWLRQSDFFLRPIGLDRYPVPGSVAEKVDLRECKVRYIA